MSTLKRIYYFLSNLLLKKSKNLHYQKTMRLFCKKLLTEKLGLILISNLKSIFLLLRLQSVQNKIDLIKF